mmetsp:Transcript_41896/g.51573  ORF Transcript_41896/g.51573 Transcript_41896/m.51573 type:complete len:251 (-) Transcript_41896:111-863(-)
MSSTKDKKKYIVIGGGVLLLAGLGYYIYSSNQSSTNDDDIKDDYINKSMTDGNNNDTTTIADDVKDSDVTTDNIPDETETDIKDDSKIDDINAKTIKYQQKMDKYTKIIDEQKKMTKYQYKNGKLKVTVFKATNVDNKDGPNEESDPFVEISINNGKQKKRTKVKKNTKNPEWNETFEFDIKDAVKDKIYFDVYDKDLITKNEKIGTVAFKIIDICAINGKLIKNDYNIAGSKRGAKLFIDVQYYEPKKK